MASKASADMMETTGPPKTKVEVLDKVFSLATQFSTCVEAFNRIHPSKDNDHAQKVALAKLGLQQSRLLIFGDAVGISAPPATIARHMIPSHPGTTTPDPHRPVNFGVRDSRLDDDEVHEKVRVALNEIGGRPAHLSRDELMEKYGLKSPKRFSMVEYPVLDTNRMAAFREKYALLQDLVRQSGVRASIKRSTSMTTNNWTVKDATKFGQYAKNVRIEVDALIELFGVGDQIDRGTRSDIRCMAWHPEATGPIVQQDWEKLRLIREACEVDYPQYIEVADSALQYLTEELRGTSLANKRAALGIPSAGIPVAADARRKSDFEIRAHTEVKPAAVEGKTALQIAAEGALIRPKISRNPSRNPSQNKGDKRPGWLSAFKFKSWAKSNKVEKERSKSTPGPDEQDPPRSFSEVKIISQLAEEEEFLGLEPVRSKSLSAIPDAPAPLNLDTRMHDLSINAGKNNDDQQDISHSQHHNAQRSSFEKNALAQTVTANSDGDHTPLTGATTVNSLIDRHDMYRGMGRIETKDIRDKAHDPAL
jgi:hypothetical protein